MQDQITRKEAIADAINAIDGQIATVQFRLNRAYESKRPDYHLRYLLGAIEGLEMARSAMRSAHLVPPIEAA
jgi:hypothetical protein